MLTMLIFVCKLNDGAATKFVCLMEIIQHQDVAMGQDKICGRGGGMVELGPTAGRRIW